MSKSYVIERVSPEPKTWESKFGPMVTYRVMFEGLQEPVEINKKPDSPKPNKGDEVFGHIETTEYGKKFKSEPNPNFTASASTKGYTPKKEWQPRDDDRIVAQWAIGQSTHWLKTDAPTTPTLDVVEEVAKEFYAMADRVKGGSESTDLKLSITKPTNSQTSTTSKSLKEQWDKTTSKSEEESLDQVAEMDADEEIDLSQIPF